MLLRQTGPNVDRTYVRMSVKQTGPKSIRQTGPNETWPCNFKPVRESPTVPRPEHAVSYLEQGWALSVFFNFFNNKN